MGFASLCRVSFALLWISVTEALVEPPTNVTLHCQSMNNVLKWDYKQNTPGLRFRVDIRAYYGINADGFRNVSWVEPPAREADLSFLSDPSEAYYVTVTAVVGEEESDPSPSEDEITFSYYRDAEVNHKCFVDLPSVNVTAQPDDKVLLRFQHPWLLLHKKELGDRQANTRKKKSHDAYLSDEIPVFDYKVAIMNQKHDHPYSCKKAVCEEMLPVDRHQEKHCLTISGELEQMVVKGNQVYCALSLEMPPARDHTHTYILIGLGVLTTFSVLIFSMIYFKKTESSSDTPHFLITTSPTSSEALSVERTTVNRVDAVSPPLLLERPDIERCIGITHPSFDYTTRVRLGLPSEDEGVSDDIEAEQPGEEASAYMHGGSLDEDEVSSGYEKRGVPVQLEPGDMAEGYRG